LEIDVVASEDVSEEVALEELIDGRQQRLPSAWR
jgi:hypothetical protein